MNGIDVSGWQPSNITALVDYDFAIIKATEGIHFVSPQCDQQYQIAKSKNKGLGVYHFASGLDPVAEADFFVNNIQGYLSEAILVLDWEANAIPKGADYVCSFVRRIKERTNISPLIYGSLSPMQSAGIDKVAAEEDCGLWVAAYPSNNPTGYYAADQLLGGVIRQYSSHGSLAGYNGNLDLNYSILTLDQWKKYALGKRAINVPVPVNPLRRSNEDIATEVMRGAWGNGDDRKARLAAAGYDYQAIQDIINGKYVRRSDDEIVTEVINGKWGIGDDRRARLTGQGYDYNVIQNKVNEKLNTPVVSNEIYIVIPAGSSLSGIASQYGTSVAQILVWNKPKYPIMTSNYIQAGWTIKVK
jgi:GH25 family lysozyme M1 (1,4-beta-N-acetylmuramidase)/LysM repeat protein